MSEPKRGGGTAANKSKFKPNLSAANKRESTANVVQPQPNKFVHGARVFDRSCSVLQCQHHVVAAVAINGPLRPALVRPSLKRPACSLKAWRRWIASATS
jgi:hypothetical protein